MMKKIAKLVEVSFTSRIIVSNDDPETVIIQKAKENVRQRLDLEFEENVTGIDDDLECPYGTFEIDKIS